MIHCSLLKEFATAQKRKNNHDPSSSKVLMIKKSRKTKTLRFKTTHRVKNKRPLLEAHIKKSILKSCYVLPGKVSLASLDKPHRSAEKSITTKFKY